VSAAGRRCGTSLYFHSMQANPGEGENEEKMTGAEGRGRCGTSLLPQQADTIYIHERRYAYKHSLKNTSASLGG
jgi:hypothetical protein